MEIGGQYGFYDDVDEQRVIGRGERDRLASLDQEDLYVCYEERSEVLRGRQRSKETLTPDLNESLLVEINRLREDKIIVDGVARQVRQWQNTNLPAVSR